MVFKPTSMIKMFIALLSILAVTQAANSNYRKVEPIEEKKINDLEGKPPGIAVRFNDRSIDELFQNLQYFLP